MTKSLVFVSASLLSLLFSGCASYNRIADYPTPQQTANVAVTAKPMSKMSELPIGAYYDKDRQIIVSGHQKGLGWGLAFGLVGVLVADSANRSSAEKRFGETTHGSAADLGTITREVLQEELTAQHAPQWISDTSPAQLKLSPYALFTVLPSGKARLFCLLRAEIPGPSEGDPKWSVRYFARAPGEYLIEGNDGWMAQDRFATGMKAAIRRAMQACIADTSGKLKGSRATQAKGVFPYMNTDKFPLPFIIVQEGEQEVIAKLAAGDVMVMAGTHVLENADYTFTPATFKDPRK